MKPIRVLLVEDEEDLVEMYTMKLRKGGFVVDACTDGLEAITHLQEKIPDIVLLDIFLPSFDGYDILKIIRSNPDTAQVPVFIISNCSEDEAKQRGDALGAERYFVKADITPGDIVVLLQEYFNDH